MYSRFVLRSMQTSSSSMILKRCLSLTQVQRSAATKLKEKPTTTDSKPVNDDQKPIPAPSTGSNDPNKTYSDKIQRLVGEISQLSLVDVMDLNELLKVRVLF